MGPTPRLLVAALALSSTACTNSRGPDGEADGALTLDDNAELGSGDDPAETDGGCQSDAECTGDPNGPVCDEATGLCHPECEPGDVGECYEGPAQTLGVGECAAGTRSCQSSGVWGACLGQTLPSAEICGNDVDEDCDGVLTGADLDGDGWGSCEGDCCDDEVVGCVDAHLVNPGAFEVPDNELDDDCDGMIDELDPSCDGGLASNSSDPLHYAAAMELCQTTTEDPPLPERTWGVISAKFSLANGQSTPLSVQRSIRPVFGDGIVPSGGDSLVVLSTGNAAAPGQTQPNYAPFESGQNLGTTVQAPADWVVANGGEFPASCEGLNPTVGTAANDSVMLTLRVRVPTNARSFTTRMFFFTAEYPEWVCSEYNDFFVTLIDSAAVDNPGDKNIAIFDDGQDQWPVGLNILKTAPGLFRVCESGNVGCQGELAQEPYECPDGPDLLAGTGFDTIDVTNSCNGNDFPVGGGTGWLVMSGNVEPGEIMEIRFAIWDAGGHLFDALVLLDDWRWSLDAASPGVSTP
ncbi:MAG TPA: choice-of-anchor L domain-containing protein [Enhygromyxa sp.]|nr:choice-of-anchor L domain-containing protein [Enhygromyxa sp.]